MLAFTRIFDKIVFLCAIASGLLIWGANSHDLTSALAAALAPAYVPKPRLTTQEAFDNVLSMCEKVRLDLGLNSLPENCAPTPKRVADEQERDLSYHRSSFVVSTIMPWSTGIAITAALLGILLLLIALGRVFYNLYVEHLRPAFRRANAPSRNRHMEQEFLHMKLLHENGVLSDSEFAAKKEQLRARVMAE